MALAASNGDNRVRVFSEILMVLPPRNIGFTSVIERRVGLTSYGIADLNLDELLGTSATGELLR